MWIPWSKNPSKRSSGHANVLQSYVCVITNDMLLAELSVSLLVKVFFLKLLFPGGKLKIFHPSLIKTDCN